MRSHTPIAIRVAISVLGALGLHRRALDLARRRGPTSSLSSRLLTTIGKAHLAEGQIDEAARWFSEALFRIPGDARFRGRLEAASSLLIPNDSTGATGSALKYFRAGLDSVGAQDWSQATRDFRAAGSHPGLASLAGTLAERCQERQWLSGRFCVRPFTDIHVNRGGRTTPCCAGWLPVKLGSVLTRSRGRIWNSRTLRSVRASIHDGSYRYCDRSRCPHLIAGDLPRREEITDPRLRHVLQHRIVRLERGPARVALGFDRACNLSCPSCRTSVETLSPDERREAELIMKAIEAGWMDDAVLLKTSNAGDIFGSPFMKGVLQDFDTERWPNLRFQLITNGLGFTPQNWAGLARIQKRIVELEISVDAARADTYALVRRGGDFNRLMRNFEFIHSLRQEGFLPYWALTFVVQNRNFREMADFVRLGRRFEVDRVIFQKVTIRNWLTAAPDIFRREFAVHDPRNPEHTAWLAGLEDPLLCDPIVQWKSLADPFEVGEPGAAVRTLAAFESSEEQLARLRGRRWIVRPQPGSRSRPAAPAPSSRLWILGEPRSHAPRPRLRRLRTVAATVLLAMAASSGVMEAALRWRFPQTVSLRFRSREGIEVHTPGSQVTVYLPGSVATVSINSIGLRAHELAAEKPDDTRRILVLGDSMTEGLAVDDAHLWTRLVEAGLRSALPPGNQIEVINSAQAGAGTADELRLLEAYGTRLRPDIVVLAFNCGNDVADNLDDPGMELVDGEWRVRPHLRPSATSYWAMSTRSYLASHSHLWQFTRRSLRLLRPDASRKAGRGGLDGVDDRRMLYVPPQHPISGGWRRTFDLLDEMESRAHAMGARFAIVAIPSRTMVDREFRKGRGIDARPGSDGAIDPRLASRIIAGWASDRRVPVVELQPEFERRGNVVDCYVGAGVDWNANGHRTAAAGIEALFLETDLLRTTRTRDTKTGAMPRAAGDRI